MVRMFSTSAARCCSSSASRWFSRVTLSSESASVFSVRASSSAFDEMKLCRASSSARLSFFTARSSFASADFTMPEASARCFATATAALSGPDSSVTSTCPFLTTSPRSTATRSIKPSTGLRISIIWRASMMQSKSCAGAGATPKAIVRNSGKKKRIMVNGVWAGHGFSVRVGVE